MKKRFFFGCLKILMVILAVFLGADSKSQSNYPVTIRTTVVPPVSPYFDQMLSSISGGRLLVMVSGSNVTGGTLPIKIMGSLQRLSPSPFTISLNTNFQPGVPINLLPGLPVTLSPDLLQQTFGYFNTGNLATQDISMSQMRDGSTYKLPEGTYRICFTAYSYNDIAYARPLSDPNVGCSVFSVCYKASAPQFILPVSGMNLSTEIGTVSPAYPLIFSWTTPNYSCAAGLPPLNYDLEIHEVIGSQTAVDALKNPPLFLKQGLPSTMFPLDTNLYRNILRIGKSYAIRVHANTSAGAVSNAITFDNNGYSTPMAFKYGQDSVAGPASPVTGNPTAFDSTADCGLTPPTDSLPANASTNLTNVSLTIGEFTLIPSSFTRNTDSTYKGSGTIAWKPLGNTIKLAVVFSNIKVNKENQVYAGLVTSSTAQPQFQGFGSWNSFSKASGSQLDQLSNSVDNFLSNNKAAQVVSQITGNTPVNFPIGLDNQSFGGTPLTLAIMSMTFSPKGATMSVLCNINIPEANGWLSLAGTGLCLKPSGMNFAQGTLLLPTDRYFTFGSDGDSLIFQGSPSADSTNGTYLTWAGDSLSAVVAHARISFPKSTIVRDDSTGKILDSAVVASLGFRFHKWDDWVANITMPSFQIVGVKGLSFLPGTIYYDHSNLSNADGFNLPKNYTGMNGNDFEGLYISDMKVLLPPDFKTFNQGTSRTSFEAKNLVIDTKGVKAVIYPYFHNPGGCVV